VVFENHLNQHRMNTDEYSSTAWKTAREQCGIGC
jgi:hypothetical protein